MKKKKRIQFTYGATDTGALKSPLPVVVPRKANAEGAVTTGGSSFDYNGLFSGIGNTLNGLGGLFGGLFGNGGVTAGSNKDTDSSGNPIIVEQKSSNGVWIAVGVGGLLVVGILAFVIFGKKK